MKNESGRMNKGSAKTALPQTVDKVVNGLFKWKKQEKGKATSNK